MIAAPAINRGFHASIHEASEVLRKGGYGECLTRYGRYIVY
jgi:hypothetical protein